jgi:hypothetical protein
VTFNPKIIHRIAGMGLSIRRKRTPQEYLDDWQQSDRGYTPNELEYINNEMQELYPGPYKVVKKTSKHKRFYYYEIEFDSPAAKTFFKLKWP